MRKLNILLFLCLMTVALQAQFINNGATVTIQSGATLRVETSIQNNGTGIINNSGTIEVSGDFTNAGTATGPSGSGLVKFIGTGNSNVDMGGDALFNVEMAKTTATGTVTLTSPLSVGGNVSFTGSGNNKILIGNNDMNMTNPAATVTGAGANGYVVTDKTGANTGKFIKSVAMGASAKTLEVGDDTNYSPITMTVNASSTGTVGTQVLSNTVVGAPLTAKYAEATEYIKREWIVATTNLTSNSMVGTYVAGDVVETTPGLIKGATFYSGDWHFDGSAGAGTTVTATTTQPLVRLSGKNFFGKANLKAFLAGAFNGTSMTTTLRTNNLIPLASPYSVAPFNAPAISAPSIPANATDWILVEVRNAVTPSTLISQTSAFILSDGSIVNYEGSPLRLKNAVANGHIALKHRNHLGIRTLTAMDLINPPALKNFSLGTGEAYTDGSISTNANMRLVGSLYAMWGGDVNQDGYVRYTSGFIPPSTSIPSDALLIFAGLGNNPAGQLSTYSNFDVNLDRYTRYTNGFIPPSTSIPSDALLIFAYLDNVPSNQRKIHF